MVGQFFVSPPGQTRMSLDRRVPVVALGLTLSFGLYAYLKTLPVGPNQGFFLKVLLLTPFALAYLVYSARLARLRRPIL